MKKKTKIITFIFLIIITLRYFLPGAITYEKFNSYKWKHSNLDLEKNWTMRWDMMNSLRNKHQLVGKSYDEIIKLLGKPGSEVNNELHYYLGFSKHGINTGHLFIKIDKNKRVISFYVFEG
jgi:hypothetical protein